MSTPRAVASPTRSNGANGTSLATTDTGDTWTQTDGTWMDGRRYGTDDRPRHRASPASFATVDLGAVVVANGYYGQFVSSLGVSDIGCRV